MKITESILLNNWVSLINQKLRREIKSTNFYASDLAYKNGCHKINWYYAKLALMMALYPMAPFRPLNVPGRLEGSRRWLITRWIPAGRINAGFGARSASFALPATHSLSQICILIHSLFIFFVSWLLCLFNFLFDTFQCELYVSVR